MAKALSQCQHNRKNFCAKHTFHKGIDILEVYIYSYVYTQLRTIEILSKSSYSDCFIKLRMSDECSDKSDEFNKTGVVM